MDRGRCHAARLATSCSAKIVHAGRENDAPRMRCVALQCSAHADYSLGAAMGWLHYCRFIRHSQQTSGMSLAPPQPTAGSSISPRGCSCQAARPSQRLLSAELELRGITGHDIAPSCTRAHLGCMQRSEHTACSLPCDANCSDASGRSPALVLKRRTNAVRRQCRKTECREGGRTELHRVEVSFAAIGFKP